MIEDIKIQVQNQKGLKYNFGVLRKVTENSILPNRIPIENFK